MRKCCGLDSFRLTLSGLASTLPGMSTRRPSKSAPFVPCAVPASAAERILRALELGRRGQWLRTLNTDARSRKDPRAR